MTGFEGACLCGGCKISVASDHADQIACHCKDCSLSSGAGFSTNILAKQTDVKITGDVGTYGAKAASGNIVERLFCKNCGSALAHKSVAFGDAMAVQTGNIPAFRAIPFGAELFTKDRYTGIGPIAGAAQHATMPQ